MYGQELLLKSDAIEEKERDGTTEKGKLPHTKQDYQRYQNCNILLKIPDRIHIHHMLYSGKLCKSIYKRVQL